MDNPTKIYQDNKSIAVATNPKHHAMMKHVDIRGNFISDHLKTKELEDLEKLWQYNIYSPWGGKIAVSGMQDYIAAESKG
ncbi:hypothetical protein HK100_007220, partial [Physocladia obscura]